jgi:hypothetical protein
MNAGFVSSVRSVQVGRGWLAAPALVGILIVGSACGGDGSTDPNTPRAMAAVSPDSQTTAAGVKMAQPLVVLVTGGGGSPLANVPVEWTITAGGGSLSDTVSTTDAAGHAQTTYTPGTLPTIAGVTAENGSQKVVFRVVLVPGPPSALQKFGSDSPAAVVGSKLTLSVRLVDQFANAISGKVVNWTAAGGSVSAGTSTTDNGGVASVTYTLGSDPGTYSLTAASDGVPPTTFSVRAIP